MSTLIGVRRALIRRTRIPFSITFTDKKSDTSGGTVITYNTGGNPSIGATAGGNRIIVICLSGIYGGTPTTTACVVNGATATRLGNRDNGTMGCVIFYINDTNAGTTSLTSASVQITFPGAAGATEIGVYSVVTSTPSQTPTVQSGANFGSASSITQDTGALSVPSGGGSIGVVVTNGAVPPLTWSGPASITKDYDDTVGVGGDSGAHTLSTGSLTYTVTFNAAATTGSFLVVSGWAP